ncbi:MAG: hypothetical protein IJD02_02840 [Lachnospiraceae bacterium]|nr:hypothetical protein [Lachnospiraceae bacterium]
MKRFLNLVITNMANSLKPMIILAVITIVVQVGLYSFNLVTREDYKEIKDAMETADEEDVICYRTVEFITDKEEMMFYILMIIIGVSGISLTGNKQREKDGKISVLRMLPAKRATLFWSNALANMLAVVGIYIVNIGCVGLCCLIYGMLVHEKFMEAGIDRIDGSDLWGMIWYLFTFIVSALVMTCVHSKRVYSINAKKRGGQNE